MGGGGGWGGVGGVPGGPKTQRVGILLNCLFACPLMSFTIYTIDPPAAVAVIYLFFFPQKCVNALLDTKMNRCYETKNGRSQGNIGDGIVARLGCTGRAAG